MEYKIRLIENDVYAVTEPTVIITWRQETPPITDITEAEILRFNGTYSECETWIKKHENNKAKGFCNIPVISP
jgi:hypothetical protein